MNGIVEGLCGIDISENDELQTLTGEFGYLNLTRLGMARPGTADLGLVGGVRMPLRDRGTRLRVDVEYILMSTEGASFVRLEASRIMVMLVCLDQA